MSAIPQVSVMIVSLSKCAPYHLRQICVRYMNSSVIVHIYQKCTTKHVFLLQYKQLNITIIICKDVHVERLIGKARYFYHLHFMFLLLTSECSYIHNYSVLKPLINEAMQLL